jgi:metallophosphoesterase (TIGR00282 family)
MIGDIVGRPGRRALKDNIASLVSEFKVDLTIANGENSAGGNGLTREVGRELFALGIDVITMGNHVWNHKEIFNYIEQEKRIIRPANYPPGAPGSGVSVFMARNGISVAVMNLSGRVFMPELDCPFRKADEMLASLDKQIRVVLLDFHAEASSEKVAMGWYLDGRVSAVCGTHTHVQTADERILPEGTAYITDVGMTGPRDSVIGVKKELVIEKFITQLPRRFEVAGSNYQLNAVLVEVDDISGRAIDINRIQNYE